MTMRLGFVGVGNWAAKLATAFRECGAESIGYARSARIHDEPAPEIFGKEDWSHWCGLVDNPDVDAVIACAPPDITTEVALACAKAGKRCVATKPLMWTERPDYTAEGSAMIGRLLYELDRHLYVDLWRLNSPAWLAMKEELRGKKIERIDVAFCGNGPFRSFNGVLDYGPHAMAFVYDLLGTTEVEIVRGTWSMHQQHGHKGLIYDTKVRGGGVEIGLRIGNGAEKPQRTVWVFGRDNKILGRFDEPEDGTETFTGDESLGYVKCSKSLALRRFCRAFMAGESSRTLEFSISAQRVLERIVNGTGNS